MKTERLIKTVQANGHLQLELPEFSNQQIEIEVRSLSDLKQPESLMALQEKSGCVE